MFTKETRHTLLPLARCVVVGVDDIEARWWVQEENPAWLGVGATGNHLAQLTTHTPDGACAACAHPVPLAPQTIPTISFVSFWAGLLQACALVTPTPAVGRNVVVYPFALGGTTPASKFELVPNPTCPINCPASAALISPTAPGHPPHTLVTTAAMVSGAPVEFPAVAETGLRR